MKTIRSIIHIFLAFAIVTTFQPASAELVGASKVTAVPVAVDFGAAGTLGTARVSVLRGFDMTPVFGLFVTSTDGVSGITSTCQALFSETNTFGTAGSQAIIGVPLDDPVICPDSAGDIISNGALLDVCATLRLLQNGEYINFSQEVCHTIDPQ